MHENFFPQETLSDLQVEDVDIQTVDAGFFKGIIGAMPAAILFWAALIWSIKAFL